MTLESNSKMKMETHKVQVFLIQLLFTLSVAPHKVKFTMVSSRANTLDESNPLPILTMWLLFTGECAILEYDAELSKCLPIKAELIVHYRGPSADDDLVNDYVQGLFEETLLENPDKLLVGYVEKISYVGNRSALFQIESGTVPSNSNDTFGAIISAATFFTIGSIFFLLRWKQRQTKHIGKGRKGPDELQEVDLETPRTQCSDSSFNDVSSPNMPEMFDTVLVERISSTPVSLSQQDDDQAIHRVSPITSTDAVVPPILTSLPPRPPMRSTTRRSSQVLKKRRRRKKKKKKPIGKRGNSRDCIQPMECIPEDEEEGSDSEHTWTDDDGSSNQSWAGSFPDSSPKLSPQNEFFSSEGFSTDIDFIIEAPDFPFDKHAEKTKQFRPNENRIKPRPKDFVSHIKEESAESIRASISGGESHNSVRLLI